MSGKRIGRQTIRMDNPPAVAAGACVVGDKEGAGPLRLWFDYISPDSYFRKESWEKAESLSLAAMAVDGGLADSACAMTSSHFCSTERQFRLPLEYGGQRPPTSQWTVTGAGAVILTSEGVGPYITHVTTGIIRDAGVTDANNMGAAMVPAAYDTLRTHFADTCRTPGDYDAFITGDLGYIGHRS